VVLRFFFGYREGVCGLNAFLSPFFGLLWNTIREGKNILRTDPWYGIEWEKYDPLFVYFKIGEKGREGRTLG